MGTQGLSLFGITRVLSLLALLGGCGGGDDRDDNANIASSSGVGNGIEANADPTGPLDSCPLTAKEVSDVLGTEVKQDTATCMFEPRPGIEPRVVYVRQGSFVCSDAVVKDPSFWLEPYDGLGVQAYASSEGGEFLVCADPPFGIKVSITPPLDATIADSDKASAEARASERAAAEQLARLILDR